MSGCIWRNMTLRYWNKVRLSQLISIVNNWNVWTKAFAKKHPSLFSLKGVILWEDNARLHSTRKAQPKIRLSSGRLISPALLSWCCIIRLPFVPISGTFLRGKTFWNIADNIMISSTNDDLERGQKEGTPKLGWKKSIYSSTWPRSTWIYLKMDLNK